MAKWSDWEKRKNLSLVNRCKVRINNATRVQKEHILQNTTKQTNFKIAQTWSNHMQRICNFTALHSFSRNLYSNRVKMRIKQFRTKIVTCVYPQKQFFSGPALECSCSYWGGTSCSKWVFQNIAAFCQLAARFYLAADDMPRYLIIRPLRAAEGWN